MIMKLADARKILAESKAEGYQHISITAPFLFNGGERVRVIHLSAPKSGDWVISNGTAVTSEWVGGEYGYMLHTITLDSGETIKVARGDVYYTLAPVVVGCYLGTGEDGYAEEVHESDCVGSACPIKLDVPFVAPCFDCEQTVCVCDHDRCQDCFEMRRECICMAYPLVKCYYSADCDGSHSECDAFHPEYEGCDSDDPFCECLFCIPSV